MIMSYSLNDNNHILHLREKDFKIFRSVCYTWKYIILKKKCFISKRTFWITYSCVWDRKTVGRVLSECRAVARLVAPCSSPTKRSSSSPAPSSLPSSVWSPSGTSSLPTSSAPTHSLLRTCKSHIGQGQQCSQVWTLLKSLDKTACWVIQAWSMLDHHRQRI